MDEMVNVGVLRRKHGGSEWALPIFVVPKKDKRIRIVSDSREVNMQINRRPYPMPRIHDKEWICTLSKEGFEHAVLLL